MPTFSLNLQFHNTFPPPHDKSGSHKTRLNGTLRSSQVAHLPCYINILEGHATFVCMLCIPGINLAYTWILVELLYIGKRFLPIICCREELIKSDTEAREWGAWWACSCVTSQTNLSYWQVLQSKNTTLGHYQTSTTRGSLQYRLTLS